MRRCADELVEDSGISRPTWRRRKGMACFSLACGDGKEQPDVWRALPKT